MPSPIPQPPGVPLLGNIFDVDPNNTWGSLRKLAEKHGEIFKIKVLGQQIVFVCSAALLEEICDETRFRKCVTGPIVEIRHSVHDSLFTAYDNESSWGIAHRIMAPLLSTSAIQGMVPDMGDSASQLALNWSKSGFTQRFNVTDDLRRLNIQSTVRCLLGQELQCLDGPEPPVIGAMENATQEAVKRPTRPKILNALVFQRRFDADTKTMREFAADIVQKRQSQQGAPENDMLHALLYHNDPSTGKSLTDSQVVDEIVSLLIGTVTAPNFLGFTLYYLLLNPQVIKKACQEIDSVLPAGTTITHKHLATLPYCEAILREAMRLSAPAPGFNIEPLPSPKGSNQSSVPLAGGKYEIPSNQVMIAILSAVNRDPAVFSDPESFVPERMLDGGYEKLPKGVRKGFGNGKRECIGKLYAWQWCFVTLVTILRETDLKMADPGYELKINGAFSVMPLELYAVGEPRGSNGDSI